jgi:flagellar biosynthesis protein FlhF
LLVTKTDEAPDHAGLFDLAATLKVPVRWITDGQEVPFDLVSAAEAMAAARFGAASGEMVEVR